MAKKLNTKVRASLFVFVLMLLFSDLIISCKKKNPEQTDAAENSAEAESDKTEENDFYIPSDDDASWVEALLMKIEEERIAEELAAMEESRSNYELLEESLLDYEEQEAQNEAEQQAENQEGHS